MVTPNPALIPINRKNGLTEPSDLFVDPEVRSKGYGRQLIQAVVDIAKEKDRLRVQWATQHGNPARKLYDQMATCDSVEYRVKF